MSAHIPRNSANDSSIVPTAFPMCRAIATTAVHASAAPANDTIVDGESWIELPGAIGSPLFDRLGTLYTCGAPAHRACTNRAASSASRDPTGEDSHDRA